MGKPTKNMEALKWLWEVLPKGYDIQTLGKNHIRIGRVFSSGGFRPVLTTENPAELQVFLQTFVEHASPAVIDQETAAGVRAQREDEQAVQP